LTALRSGTGATPRRRWRTWREVAEDLDRLNHILIPQTHAERERWRRSRAARVFRRIARIAGSFTEDGQLLVGFAVAAIAISIDVGHSDTYLVWALLTGVTIASWAFTSLYRLRGVTLEAAAPRRVTAGEEASFALSLRNEGPIDFESVRVRGALLTWDGTWTAGRAELATIRRGESARVELRARFDARGDHELDPFRARALVPLGFTHGPALESAPLRLLVVPRIAHVVSLSSSRPRRQQPGGMPRAVHTADARELVGVRPYRFGDPARDLHARTWARTGEPTVREYREEYFSRVGIVLDTDVSRAEQGAFEAAISLVAGVVSRLATSESLVDMIVLGTIAHPLGRGGIGTLGSGQGTLDRALELLARVERGGPFDADALDAVVAPRLATIASWVFVAARWDDERRAFVDRLRSVGTAALAIVVARGDPPPALDGAVFVSADAVAARQEVAL
jgi:uncharacterized protein (DUF58 family)